MRFFFYISFTSAMFLQLFVPEVVLATQTHGAPEGIYVHQASHIFFIFAMTILIYWLRSRNLIKNKGWRMIQYAGIFFILWSLDAFAAHFMDEQAFAVEISRVSRWQVFIDPVGGYGWLAWLYYLIKLDHLFCVPAMVFLYLGLRRLSHTVCDIDTTMGRGT